MADNMAKEHKLTKEQKAYLETHTAELKSLTKMGNKPKAKGKVSLGKPKKVSK